MGDLSYCSPLWVSVGCMMVYFLCMGFTVGLLVFAARRILVRFGPTVRYRLTLGCLAVLVLSPAVLVPWIEARVQSPSGDENRTSAVAQPAGDEELPSLWTGHTTDQAQPVSMVRPERSRWWLVPQRVLNDDTVRLLAWISVRGPWVWLGGVIVMAALTAGGLLELRRMRLDSVPESGRIQAAADAICASVGLRPIPVRSSSVIASPLLIGWFRPAVLLPGAAQRAWTNEQVEMVLLHELTHARRRDNLMNLLQRVFEIVFFFNPAVWYLSRCVRLDREEICDRAVLARTGRRLAYAELLFGFASLPAACRMAAAMGEHNLVSRVRDILESDEPAPRHSRRGIASAGVAVVVASLGMGAFRTISAVPVPRLRPTAADTRQVVERQPAAPDGSKEQQPDATTTGATVTSFLLRDQFGRPVQGALAGTNVRLRNGIPDWEEQAGQTSDAQGLVSSAVALKPDTMAQFYFYDPQQHLAGTTGLMTSEIGSSVLVAMVPPCRVRLNLQIAGGDSLTWTKCFIRIADPESQSGRCRVRDAYLLRQTRSSESPGAWSFEYDLPPGRYELLAIGGDDSKTLTIPRGHSFEVPAGVAELDLGDLKVCMKPGSQLPE